jgi:hypothetical protein
MSGLCFHQIEPSLDAFDTLVKPIYAPMNAGEILFDVGHPHLYVLRIADKTIKALFHTRQARWDLLQHRHDEVGDFAHAYQHICSCVVPQAATEMR